jgi:2-desacetyl-2-hydroxyethyl bacteriochlorophyllide A dehydrogenase
MMSIPHTMKALQLQGPDQLVLTELPVPSPKEDEVLIQTMATTICTSDLHEIKTNPFGIKLPKVPGHEAAGIIVKFGSAVHGLQTGMRVAAHPVVPCGICVECKRGFGHLCLNMGHLGIDRNGTFAQYFVQRADRIRTLPDNIPFALGALLEPVANCLQAVARAGNIQGKTVLVVGDGPFGNIIARLALKAKASQVMVSGREPFRLSMIPGIRVVDTPPVHAVDISILAVSASDAMLTCMSSLRKRGRAVVFSLIEDPVPLNLFDLHISELEIVGCCNDENRMDDSLRCLSDPVLNLSEIVTHEIPFDNWQEAFHLARDCHDKALKVAIMFDR